MEDNSLSFQQKIAIFESKFDTPKTPRTLDRIFSYTGHYPQNRDPGTTTSHSSISKADKLAERNKNIGINLEKYTKYSKSQHRMDQAFTSGTQSDALIEIVDVETAGEEKHETICEKQQDTVTETVQKFEDKIIDTSEIAAIPINVETTRKRPKKPIPKPLKIVKKSSAKKFLYPPKIPVPESSLNTIEEVTEATSSDIEPMKQPELFNVFEKLDTFIDYQITEMEKNKKRPNQKQGAGKTQDFTQNEEEFFEVLRGLASNREKFFQEYEKGIHNISVNGHYPEKSTPTDKITPPEKGSPKDPLEKISLKVNGTKISPQPLQSKETRQKSEFSTLKHSPLDESSPIQEDYPTPTKKTRIVKFYKSIDRLEYEIQKQEIFLAKLNRILNFLVESEYSNFESMVLGERHYLVSMLRTQACLTEIERIKSSGGCLRYKSPFEKKGSLVIQDIHIEIKPDYFTRELKCENEYMVCVLRYRENVIASHPIQIMDDIRSIRFPESFIFNNVFLDFDIRLEIYGTANWKKRHSLRDTALKKYGFFTLTSDDISNRKFNLIEIVPSNSNPLKKKVYLKIQSKITVNSHYSGILYIYCKNKWQKSWALLNGHVFKIWIGSKSADKKGNFVIFDLRNSDGDTIFQVQADLYRTKYAFRVDFNQYVEDEEFSLLLAAEDEKGYLKWTRKINQSIALLKCK